MAPFVPLPGGAQVIIIQLLGGLPVSNRLWFTFDTPPFGLTDLQGLADGVSSWWRLYIMPALSYQLQLLAVEARSWIADPPPLIALNATSAAGGLPEESYSANVAVIVPFVWPIDVRLKRNKHFVCGIPDSGVVLNTVQLALQDALFEGYAALVDAARLFTPTQHWLWVATSASENGSFRAQQYAAEVEGPPLDTPFILGQRRRRLG
jgi:hypothetical protein